MCSAQLRWKISPSSDVPLPKIRAHHAPVRLPKRVYRPNTMIGPAPPSQKAHMIVVNMLI